MQKERILAGTLLAALLSVGCGSSGSNPSGGSGFTGSTGLKVLEPAPVLVNGEKVDDLDVEAFDAQGNRLAGPYHVPFTAEMSFPALPPETAVVEVDYNRHGSLTLARARVDLRAQNRVTTGADGQTVLDNPSEQAVQPASSKWRVVRQPDNGFKLEQNVVDDNERAQTNENFRIKGVCYSPCPINVLGDGAPGIGDLFFDNVIVPETGQVGFYNWYGLWGKGSLGDNFQARDDLGQIRGLNANVIRTYSMMSRHQGDPSRKEPDYPSPPTSGYHHQHKQFLDMCWNKGNNPIYVIVGIPLPPDNVYQGLQNNTPAKIALYNHILEETARDLKDHPAVLGFTFLNEVNNGGDAFPGTGQGGQMVADKLETGLSNSRSDFYWGQIKKYSDIVKQNAPDKLVGFCVHDFRELAQYSSNFPTPEDSYLGRATNLDFVGINTYQTVNYDSQYVTGWGGVQGPAKKPLIFSELGFPATTRQGDDPATITTTEASIAATARTVSRMLPKAYENSSSLGACYFEFSDEWWKQISDTRDIIVDNEVVKQRRTDVWFGGHSDPGFPNQWADEEGFGLFGVKRYPGKRNNDPVVNSAGPDRALDRLIPRNTLIQTVRDIFGTPNL